MDTETASGTTLPIEIRRSTAQLVRHEVGQWGWFVPMWLVLLFPIAYFGSGWSDLWFSVVTAVLVAVVSVALDVWRRRKMVVRLTEDGLYAGRDDGKKSGWLAPRPIELTWGEVRGVRLTENRWSNKVLVDTSGLTHVLPFPVSTWFNLDPELDARVELIRRTWEAERGPLPPPPSAPLFLPQETPAPMSGTG